jgi:hypothetical protein
MKTAIKGQAEYLVTRDYNIKLDNEVVSFLLKHGVTAVSISKFLDLISKP